MARKRAQWGEHVKLQWGHVFSDVEIMSEVFKWAANASLQWGHVFSDVEMAGTRRKRRYARFCFNGATSFQTWKFYQTDSRCSYTCTLQWGHVFSDVEIQTFRLLSEKCQLASMGPRLFRRGNGSAAARCNDVHPASMGPRLFRRGNRFKLRGIVWNLNASMGPRLFRRGNVSVLPCLFLM